MPRAKSLSGQSLADAIYEVTDKLEAQFAAEFILMMRKLSRRKDLQTLLDQIEGGYFSSVATIPTSLKTLVVDTSKLNAIVRRAMGSSARITNEKVGLQLSFNVRNPSVIEAARNISVDLSTNLSQTSQKIIDKVIGDAMEGIVTRREAVKIIESRVGLLPAHSDAVDRYYDTLIQSGSTKAEAKKLAEQYAERLLRYRANMIARTEIARATGIGQTEYWRQAVADGALPADTKRVWSTSYDERVCEICGPMNNVEVGIDEKWLTPNGFVDYPSQIHPNCRCSQGIALSAQQKRLFVGKTDGEKFEQYILSKFNPYHDELGRFTFAPSGRKKARIPPTIAGSRLTRRQLGLNKPIYSLVRYSSDKRKEAVRVLAENGSSKLLMPRDANGIAQVLPKEDADKRYGSTVAEVQASIKKLGLKNVTVTPEFAAGKNAVSQMQASAQAFEEAKAMGVSVKTLTVKFTNRLRDADGTYDGDTSKREGDIQIDYMDDRRAKFIAERAASAEKQSVLTNPTRAITTYTSDYPVLTAPTQNIVAKYVYGVTIHEIGHHYTYVNAENPNVNRQFNALKNATREGASTPATYAGQDKYEMGAEAFTAWWLLGGGKSPNTKAFYRRWLPYVKVVLMGNDDKFQTNPSKLLKAMVRKTKVLNLLSLPPNHPLMFYFASVVSSENQVSKFNPYHDELGRFTFAPSGRRMSRMPKGKTKRPKIKPKKKVIYGEKTNSKNGMIVRVPMENTFGVSTMVKAGVLTKQDVKKIVSKFNKEMIDQNELFLMLDEKDPRIMAGKIYDKDFGISSYGDETRAIFYKIVANRLLEKPLKQSLTSKQLISVYQRLSTIKQIIPEFANTYFNMDRIRAMAKKGTLHSEFARMIIDSWAGSSGSQLSLMLSSIAKSVLQTDGQYRSTEYENSVDGLKSLLSGKNATEGSKNLLKALTTAVQSTYDNTQKVLKESGVTHLRLYRGFINPDMEFFNVSGEPVLPRDLTVRPLSSWSSSLSTAINFATISNSGYIASKLVRAKDVFCMATTGLGCLEESEFVVKGFYDEGGTATIPRAEHTGVVTRKALNNLAEKLHDEDEKLYDS